MADRECVLRFFAFLRKPAEEYPPNQDFDFFLSERMAEVNRLAENERRALAARFERAMRSAAKIFGDDAFRKRYAKEDARNPINKALFEAWSVNLDRLSDGQIARLEKMKALLKRRFIEFCNTDDFGKSISQGTGDISRVKLRFRRIRELLEEVLAP